jgi:hypothetical protein
LADKEEAVTITRDGEVIAFYLESEIVCAQCVTEAERADSTSDENLAVEELEGAVEEFVVRPLRCRSHCERKGALLSMMPL